MNPASDTGWLVFGDVATAVAAVAALVTVTATIVYGRKTAAELGNQVTELHGITTGLANQLDELSVIGGSLVRVEEGITETAALTRGSQRAEGRQHERERLERLADRYVRIGSVVESIFWAAYNEREAPSEWQHLRNRLSVLMVGITQELPRCADVRNASSRQDAQSKAGAARGEADIAIERVHSEMAELSDE
jgi:hypothetical protein